MAEKMMVTLAESGLSVFRATSPLSRGVLKSKGGGKLSIHCCADPVEESYPTPHIHEQMTAYIMATTTSTLSQTR